MQTTRGEKSPHMFTTDQRDDAKKFLKMTKAQEISVTEADTTRRTVYEIEVREDGKTITEVWIERESKLEEPEHFYNLFQFKGTQS